MPTTKAMATPPTRASSEAAGGQRDPVSEIGAEHVERAVGEIDDAENAEHQRQAAGDQKQDHAVLNGIQQLNAER